MGCCDGWNFREIAKYITKCPDCGADVDEAGESVEGCNWSPIICVTCGDAPCDLSC